MCFQPRSQEKPRAMYTHLDVDGCEAEALRDFLVRESLDVAQHHDGAVVGGQFVESGAEHHP